ncbi:wd repeat-containing protein hypothetical protein [Limosa lapponica baueri]|uniref:Wd repeat-containing protein wrap73 n=1 Tax=Limosa lapponica baueri TaxID=1758121 RepID=A0A2I0TN80_LIMLA|nr:wd repeat-containing protein hypothetical protein [Limosa lapponica baueri]
MDRYLDGQASGVQYRLVVRDAGTLQILQLYTCLDQIQYIEWSSDSLFILCAMYKRGIVQVWSLEQPDWHCKIDEGSAGLVASCWSPDGRHILNTTEFHLRITVWSLCTKSVSYIKYPKACQQGIAFTRDGRYMAVAERRDCKDFVSIFVCSDWQLLRIVYKEVEKSPSVETERLSFPPTRALASSLFSTQSKYDIAQVPVSLQYVKPVTDRANPKMGIGMLAFSPDNCFLATKNGDFPIVSLSWSSSGDSLALLSKDNFCVCYLEREEVK